MNSEQYDVVVIGGGPSGSTAATLLADAGHRVLVLERAQFPRHHIGESLMPQSYWVFKRLGMLEEMKASGFMRKESVQFVSLSGKESAPFYFTDRDPNEWSVTWQVERGKFDKMLLDNSVRHGAKVIHKANVREVLFERDRAVGVRATVQGEEREYRCRITVDASGQSGLLSRQLDIRYGDEKLKNAAIYAYWKGALRDQGRNEGATLVIHTRDQTGWFWFIPLSNDITSIGVCAPPSYLYNGRGDDPLAILEDEIESTPAMKRRLVSAERVTGSYVTADFSYRSRRAAGNGWILVGDACCFLDPLYSSGVLLALKSGELAADIIHEALSANDVSEAKLNKHTRLLADGIQMIRQLVYAYYTPSFSFGQFIREHPECKDGVTRILIGDVFQGGLAPVFEAMGKSMNLPSPIRLEEGLAPT